MKFTKLSLIAAIAASSAFAGGDIAPVEPAPVVEATSPWSFSGDAKLYYSAQTGNLDLASGKTASIFDQYSATGQAAISADIGYAITNNWKVNLGLTGLATLGLDDSVVSNVWLYAGARPRGLSGVLPVGSSIGDALWIDTLNVTGTMFDGALTTVIGRQMLDTPLAFSETWNIAPNTFDAAVAIAKPMDNLSLIAGYIYDGNGNGNRIGTFDSHEGGFTSDDGYMPIATGTANEISNGAWTVAAVGSFNDVTAQAWYYDVMDVAQAVWVQADGNFAGFTVGGQYAWISADDKLQKLFNNKIEDAQAFAGKVGYKMDALNLWAAYSSVEDVATGKTAIPVANTATMLGNAGWGNQSKLYTEAWWNYGWVGQAGAETFAAAASYDAGSVSILDDVNVLAQYTQVSGADKFLTFGNGSDDMTEFTTVLGTKVYGLDVQVAYIWAKTTIDNVDDTTDTAQLYLTYNF
jgi:hypothetical protein